MKKAESLRNSIRVLAVLAIAFTAAVMFSISASAASSKGGFKVPATLTVTVGNKTTLNLQQTTSKYKKTKVSFSYSKKAVSASNVKKSGSAQITFTGKKAGSFNCKVTVKAYKKSSAKKASKTIKLTCKVNVVNPVVLGAEETTASNYIPSIVPLTNADYQLFSDASAAYAALNSFRAANGKATLVRDASLENCAKLRAKEQWIQRYENRTATHTRPDGNGWATAYPTQLLVRAENLGWGQDAASSDIIDAWAASTGHRAVMLHSDVTRVGIACYEKDGNTCWALCIAK